ncbi:MAG TPA: RNA methyltransferase [Mobilitalea sp.]|nr:RNA methyltransferase [Mobilitalea sp.]
MISSLSNPQVKNLTLLQKKPKARDEQGIFVIEGIKMFEEARDLGILRKTYASESFYQEMLLENPEYFEDLDYEILTDSVFKEVSETKTPQGILGTVLKADYSLESMLKAPDACLLLLEDIRDPGNLGTMIRTAEGAGVTGIIFGDSTVDIYNSKVIRATMGSIYRVPFYQAQDFYETLRRIKQEGITMYAAHLLGIPYDTEGSFCGRCAFLIGNEANGLSDQATREADALIKIPMAGKVESLNAAVAAAILMYEAARQRRKI